MSYVRIATLGDVERIVSIESEILEEDKRLMSEDFQHFRVANITPERYLSELKKKENIFIVAVEANQVVGVARGVEYKITKSTLTRYILHSLNGVVIKKKLL